MEQIEFSAKKLRDVASLYSMSSLSNVEEKIDQCTSAFMQILASKCSEQAPVDMGKWLQYYSFDSIGNLTVFSRCIIFRAHADIGIVWQTIWISAGRPRYCGYHLDYPQLWSIWRSGRGL